MGVLGFVQADEMVQSSGEAVRAMHALSRDLCDMRKRPLEMHGCAPAADLPERLEAVA